ncbi:zinc-binding dehydrogenase [Intrasporangium sp.]|jgi:NADPH2:quinone reductase|uniref:zinc-binding dehydrogenase n=1 Tax=Intrasporangium sp. TaxID=1925024 RepID=UPI0033653620
MRAIRLHEFGPAENLVPEDLPDLSPDPGQVRIAVQASGVHLVDTTLRRGEPGPMPRPALPTIPGREVAGVVDALGSVVPSEWLGRRVVAHLGMVPGGYAEQAVTDPGKLFPLPDRVDVADAVAVVGTGRTAMGILESEPVGPTDTVLIPSAAGGLGWLLAQGARDAGATVAALAGGREKVERLGALGLSYVGDYTQHGWEESVRAAVGEPSVVYDGVGGDVGRRTLELLGPGGRLVMFGYSAGEPTAFTTTDVIERGLTVSWSLGARMLALPGGIPGLAGRALDWLAAGRWSPLVTTYPLDEAAQAHADLESRRTMGKVVLLP